MTETLESPTHISSPLLPEELFVLKQVSKDLYGCYSYKNRQCLAIFSTPSNAHRFAEFITNTSHLEAKEVTIEEAIQIALSRPAKLTHLVIMDNISCPVLIPISELIEG